MIDVNSLRARRSYVSVTRLTLGAPYTRRPLGEPTYRADYIIALYAASGINPTTELLLGTIRISVAES